MIARDRRTSRKGIADTIARARDRRRSRQGIAFTIARAGRRSRKGIAFTIARAGTGRIGQYPLDGLRGDTYRWATDPGRQNSRPFSVILSAASLRAQPKDLARQRVIAAATSSGYAKLTCRGSYARGPSLSLRKLASRSKESAKVVIDRNLRRAHSQPLRKRVYLLKGMRPTETRHLH
jgi:hypothetical protein